MYFYDLQYHMYNMNRILEQTTKPPTHYSYELTFYRYVEMKLPIKLSTRLYYVLSKRSNKGFLL